MHETTFRDLLKGLQAVDWGELHHRGARHLARELALLEEDDGEIVNERFLKMLTAEVEEIAEEAMIQGRQAEAVRADRSGAGPRGWAGVSPNEDGRPS